jgi:uncharacterized repeat protein (TIGR01451 family)
MRIFWWSTMLAVVLSSVSMTSHAVSSGMIRVSSVAEVEETRVQQNGRKEQQRVRVRKVSPGTVVLFRTEFQNTDRKPVGNIVISNPIPEETEYWAGSAFGDNTDITFSVDNGKTFHAADRLDPRAAKTHIRWTYKGQLAAGAWGEVGFKAEVKRIGSDGDH